MIDYRDYALELVEDNGFDAEHMLLCCLKYMSQDDVKDMLHINEYPNRLQDNDQSFLQGASLELVLLQNDPLGLPTFVL